MCMEESHGSEERMKTDIEGAKSEFVLQQKFFHFSGNLLRQQIIL